MDEYVSQQKIQLLDSLENQVRFSQLVAVVVGESGIGKTFLLNQLQHRLGSEVQFARIDARLAMSPEQLDKTISLQLGLSWQSSSTNLARRIKDSASQKVVICIDNAELLSIECLNFSLDLNQQQLQAQDAVLFVLLAGNNTLPEMISKTDTFTQHQEMCVVFEIEAIQQSETQSLVLALKHFNADIIEAYCDDKKLNYFWQLSKGNPSELDYHLARWLEKFTQTKVVEVKQGLNTSYLKGLFYGVVAILLLTVLLYQQSINQWIAGSDNEQSIDQEIAQQKQTEEVSATQNQTKRPINNSSTRKQKVKSIDNNSLQDIADDLLTNESSQENGLEAINSAELKDEPAVKDDIIIDKKENGQNVDKLGLLIEKIDQQKKKSVEAIKIVDFEPAKTQILSDDEQALLELPATQFALQWVGLSQMATAKQYRDNHPLKAKMKIYRRNTSGKILYLVISGEFSNLASANVAKLKYKTDGYSGKPWAKSIKAIQAEIHSFRSTKQ